MEKSKDPKAFVAFELSGWRANIAGYDGAFGSVSRQTVDVTLDAANVRGGMKILDVCTGPGMLVEGAMHRGAKAVGLDFSDEVIALARKRAPAGEFQQGDAQDLPFPDDSFDAVVCGYGVMHLPEPEIALREMRRVVRPSGRIAISVWDSTTPNNAFGMIYAAVGAHCSFDVELPHGPDFFNLARTKKCGRLSPKLDFQTWKRSCSAKCDTWSPQRKYLRRFARKPSGPVRCLPPKATPLSRALAVSSGTLLPIWQTPPEASMYRFQRSSAVAQKPDRKTFPAADPKWTIAIGISALAIIDLSLIRKGRRRQYRQRG